MTTSKSWLFAKIENHSLEGQVNSDAHAVLEVDQSLQSHLGHVMPRFSFAEARVDQCSFPRKFRSALFFVPHFPRFMLIHVPRIFIPTSSAPHLWPAKMPDHPSVSESEESPYESTSHRPRKRQRQSQQSIVGPTSLQCQVCSRTYERADHLNRHLDSREYADTEISEYHR